MTKSKLAIVIHAEEEFDWGAGFYRSNTSVTHDNELISLVDKILELGGKVTLAMDYPFITSNGGRRVVERYKGFEGDKIEFAAHLHPWVNPPFEDDEDSVDSKFSYPGNLTKKFEFEKLKVLTEQIEKTTGVRPVTYLAGRYGTGKHTAEILKELGYKIDLSISAYFDFSHQQGPDFSSYTNASFSENQLTYVPHTSSVLTSVPLISNFFNLKPEMFTRIQANKMTSLLGKILRIRRFRLSPEGFSFEQMKEVTESQMRVGQTDFVLSFHSPSTKVGMTPYVNDCPGLEAFKQNLVDYIKWFNQFSSHSLDLPKRFKEE